MFIENHYIINQEFMCMTGQYDRYGKLCTLVIETNQMFFVNESPLEILDYSIRCIGFDLRGAIKTAKWLLGHEMMLPVVVNPILEIIAFPTHSPKHEDNMWFNPFHIKRTISQHPKTIVELSNGKILIIPKRLSSFNNRMQIAEQLKRLALETAKMPRVYYLDSVKRRKI